MKTKLIIVLVFLIQIVNCQTFIYEKTTGDTVVYSYKKGYIPYSAVSMKPDTVQGVKIDTIGYQVDTIKCVFLVSKQQIQHINIDVWYGYEVHKTIYIIIYDFLPHRHQTIKERTMYLDSEKKRIPKNIIIWSSKPLQ
jgi:hypothetical protein